MAQVSAFGRSRTPQAFHQVTVAWKYLTHPNIVPLLGVTVDPPQLISDRMPGGDLIEYITGHPDADRRSLVSDFSTLLCKTLLPRQLSDVAEGLNHLHSRNIVHGGLKGVSDRSLSLLTVQFTSRQSNILVDSGGHARITDFGLAVVTQDLELIRSGSDECEDSVRWIAPEILDGRGTHSKEGDVFSFGMVMIEVRCI